ncbi:hypothetical protein E2C01_001442 [Portunus trituberculatus]|uniref:Uncharacterized protein n=1 Tax=Portunus trituberculatus TaxID=210409 RepID=A0A5B7CHZ8_PORTR|nr:hypothetical protein [Portunus trituberculatus]
MFYAMLPSTAHPSTALNSLPQPSRLFQALRRRAHLTPDVTSGREGAPDSYGPGKRGARPPLPPQFPPSVTLASPERFAGTAELWLE